MASMSILNSVMQFVMLLLPGLVQGAQSALGEAGIQIFGCVSGLADEAVLNYLSGKLQYNPAVQCNHHEHEHSCHSNSCHEDKHGCSGNASHE